APRRLSAGAAGGWIAQAVEGARGHGEQRGIAVADLDALTEPAPELACATGIGQVLLDPEHERRLVLGDLHRHDADAARKRRRVEPVLAGTRPGAAEADVEHVERLALRR